MTWQKVTAVQTEADLKIKHSGGTAVEVSNAAWADRPTYELENKSGETYEFTSYSEIMKNFDRRHDKPGGKSDVINGNTQMAEDIAEALADGSEVWVDVDFDNGYVMYWATGAPWDGGTVHDDYGISAR